LDKEGEELTHRNFAKKAVCSTRKANEHMKTLVSGGYLLLLECRLGRTHVYSLSEKKLENLAFHSDAKSLESFGQEDFEKWLKATSHKAPIGWEIESSFPEGLNPNISPRIIDPLTGRENTISSLVDQPCEVPYDNKTAPKYEKKPIDLANPENAKLPAFIHNESSRQLSEGPEQVRTAGQ